MPREQVSDTDLMYYLIAYDAYGRERGDDPDGRMSDVIGAVLANEPITDVFVFSHGWNSDMPSARRQYRAWIKAMYDCTADRAALRAARPNFRPLLIGIHWPSLAWGDESFTGASDFAPAPAAPVTPLVETFAHQIADTERARLALATILTTARDMPPPAQLPAHVVAAYEVLDDESHLGHEGVGARPGADREEFDPQAIYEVNRDDAVAYGEFDNDSWLSPLRTLSFWQMKSRACYVGEHGAGDFFRELVAVTDASVRFHLMGHSFGCILVSSLLAGPNAQVAPARPAHSLILAQGAMSLWSYCAQVPSQRNRAGYFHRLMAQQRVQGPIIATISEHDLALGNWYTWGAMSARQVDFAPVDFAPGRLPIYGAVGTWGVRGQGLDLNDLTIAAQSEPYEFAPHQVYNLECSGVIRKREGPAGAHGDIARPEVAHAVWSAALGIA